MFVRPAIATCWDIDNDLGHNKCYTPKTRLTFKRLNVLALIKTSLIWALSRENLSSVVCDQVRLKPVCSATRTSEMLETGFLMTWLTWYRTWLHLKGLIPNDTWLVQDWRSMCVCVCVCVCVFSAFVICHFSFPSFTLQKNSNS